MAAPTSLDVRPVTTPHLDFDHLAVADRDFPIKDTDTSRNLMRIHYWAKDQFLNHADDINIWESNLTKYTFLEVHPFPDIIHFFHAYYVPSHRTIEAPNLEILFKITAKSINQMLQIQSTPNLTPLSIASLLSLYITLDPTKIKQIFQSFITEECHTPKDIPPYGFAIFSETVRRIITMISSIIGFTSDKFVDEIIMAFLSIFTPSQPPSIMYDYTQFIADKMHEQITRFPTERVFKYSLVFFYMFLYYQTNKIPLKIQKLDTKGKERSVIYWTPLVQRYNTTFTYKDFIDCFVHPVINMLTSSIQPRIIIEIKRILQLEKNSKVGYWYLYQNHIEIRIYGCELPPYKLHKYLLMRIFSLEYFRQIVSANDVNFLVSRNNTQFKMKNQMGPFIYNTK